MSKKSGVQISFDDLNRIRIFDSEQYQQSEQLADESSSFTEKIKQFDSTVKTLVEVLTTQSEKIETEKLKVTTNKNTHSTHTFETPHTANSRQIKIQFTDQHSDNTSAIPSTNPAFFSIFGPNLLFPFPLLNFSIL